MTNSLTLLEVLSKNSQISLISDFGLIELLIRESNTQLSFAEALSLVDLFEKLKTEPLGLKTYLFRSSSGQNQ